MEQKIKNKKLFDKTPDTGEAPVALPRGWRRMRRGEQKTKGFTLFELLVVIGIIAIIAGAIIASTSGVRAKARDEQRIAELGQIQLALQAFNEVNGRFPNECGPDNASGGSGADCDTGVWTDVGANGHICADCTGPINSIIEQYAGKRFEDPTDIGDTSNWSLGNFYYYDGWHRCDLSATNTRVVMLITQLENEPDDTSFDICPDNAAEGGATRPNAYYKVIGVNSQKGS